MRNHTTLNALLRESRLNDLRQAGSQATKSPGREGQRDLETAADGGTGCGRQQAGGRVAVDVRRAGLHRIKTTAPGEWTRRGLLQSRGSISDEGGLVNVLVVAVAAPL